MRMRKGILFLITIYCYCNATSIAQSWSPVGTGTNNCIRTLYADTISDLLYAGGNFYYAGGVAAGRIAVWNGSTWNSVGDAVFGLNVLSITRYQGDIYAGGFLYGAGTIPVSNIARWNGSSWDSLGSGTDNGVYTMAVYNNELYVGGMFTQVGGITCKYIAKWDGNNWSSICTDMDGLFISSLQVYNGKLYAGGYFSVVDGHPAWYIASWDGTTWSSVGNGLSDCVNSMTVLNGKLYIIYGSNVAIWDGTCLSALSGAIMDNTGMCMTSFNNDLFIGGWFNTIGNTSADYMAKWDQNNWSQLGGGLDSVVYAMTIYQNELYVGGLITNAGGCAVNNIAKWNFGSAYNEIHFSQNNSLSVFPNPINENTIISYYNNENSPVTIELYNCLGHLIRPISLKNNCRNQLIEIPFTDNDLPAGIYYVVLQNSFGILTEKILKLD